MAPSLSLAALAAVLSQLPAAHGAVVARRELQTAWSLRGAESQADGQEEMAADTQATPGFLERNLPWLATMPYIEGRVVSLARRVDLSKIFPEDGPKIETPTWEPPKMEPIEMKPLETPKMEPLEAPKWEEPKWEAPKVEPLETPKFEKAKPVTVPGKLPPGTPKSPLVNDDDQVEFDADRLAASHPIVDKEGKVRDNNTVLISVISSAGTLLLWFVFVISAALIYRFTKDTSSIDLDKAKGAFKDKPFAYGPFDCFEDMDVCCWSTWCGAVQWADTMGAAGTMNFWVAFLLFLALASLNFFTGVLVWLLVALVFVYFRQDLRRKLELENENADMAKDFAMWCCCCCCAIVQEARQIKAAREMQTAN